MEKKSAQFKNNNVNVQERQRKVYTVYSRHELCSYTGWSTEDINKKGTAGKIYVILQLERNIWMYSRNRFCKYIGLSTEDRQEKGTVGKIYMCTVGIIM